MTQGIQKSLKPARQQAAKAPHKVLVMPSFEENRDALACCARLLKMGETGAAYSILKARCERCRGVPSERYRQLNDYLRHALMAIETGEFEGSRYILVSAGAAFGWAIPE